jgi:hypothetical protein
MPFRKNGNGIVNQSSLPKWTMPKNELAKEFLMHRLSVISFVTLFCFMLTLAACGGDETPEPTPTSPPPTESPTVAPTASPAETPTTAAAAAPAGESNVEPFDPAAFGENSAGITNQWIPMKPGTRYVYEGSTVEDDGTVVSHTVEINITDLTKVIGGIRSRVTWDLDYSDGELVEAEIAFFAQDKEGNVWRMGEYPEEYDTGKMIANPGWIHGLQEAQAGIMMKADPQPGTSSYSEGWAPRVGWTDRGKVDAVGQKVCVPMQCYEDVLVIAETSQAEPDAEQLKSYAPNVGNIHVGWRGAGEKTKEVLDLTAFEEVTGDALMEMRNNALKLEQSALVNSPLYAESTPIELPAGVEPPDLGPAPTVAVTKTVEMPALPSAEIVVYTSELPETALSEMEVWEDAASPGGKLIGITNAGADLDPPPEVDPHVDFQVQVQEGVGYRCWIHMKVGAPKGVSTANRFYVQFEDAIDPADNPVYAIESESFLTAQGPEQEGWGWVPCNAAAGDSLVYFGTTGPITVRLQAGAEGVGFDQFVLSGEKYVEQAPAEAIVAK